MTRGNAEVGGRRSWRDLGRHVALLAAVGAVLVFYAWAVSPGRKLLRRIDGTGCFYNLLVQGFQSGHLSLKADVPAGLLALKDPYDPKLNARFGMHDVSFYKGRFYLYFGVAPALLLYWPFEAITGHYLDDSQAVFLFAILGFLATAILLVRIREKYFPQLPFWTDICGVVAVGFVTMVPVLLRRPLTYEVAVSSAYACFAVSLLALLLSLDGRRRLAWLAFGSLFYGFAVASRPTYVFGASCLLFPVIFCGALGDEPRPSVFRRAVAALAPIAVVGAGLLVYNQLRFDSPFEFGHRLALSGLEETNATHFSRHFFGFNCLAYFLEPARMSVFFPFVRVVSLPARPFGHIGIEDAYGILPNMPFVALALLAPLACRNRRPLGAFALIVAVASLSTALVLLSFNFVAYRYMVDFLPGFVVLSVLGFWGLIACLTGGPQNLAKAVGLALLGWSALFNIFASIGHNELLRMNDPAEFRRLAHFFGYPRHLADLVEKRTYGPVEMTLNLPPYSGPRLEPLIITGSEFLSDYLYVDYVSAGHLIFGFEHTSYGGVVTDAIPCDYNRPHTLKVDMPSIYPPIGDPYFDHVPKGTQEMFSRRLQVWLDGAKIIDSPQRFYPAFRLNPLIGESAVNQTALGIKFTGKIQSVARIPPDWSAMTLADRTGPLVISLVFPAAAPGTQEPLVCCGSTGRGDVLVVNYVDSTHVFFSFDHWAYGGPRSDAVEIKPGVRQTMEVWFGSFFPASERPNDVPVAAWADAGRRLKVTLDRRTVFDVQTAFYDVPPESVFVGENPIGASSCVAAFSGQIVGYIRSGLR